MGNRNTEKVKRRRTRRNVEKHLSHMERYVSGREVVFCLPAQGYFLDEDKFLDGDLFDIRFKSRLEDFNKAVKVLLAEVGHSFMEFETMWDVLECQDVCYINWAKNNRGVSLRPEFLGRDLPMQLRAAREVRTHASPIVRDWARWADLDILKEFLKSIHLRYVRFTA